MAYSIVGDVGGQKSLRPFWRNHFEETDAVIWVVDSSDRQRLSDCKAELFSLLQEEVRFEVTDQKRVNQADGGLYEQRLAGAGLLVLANKQDIPGALTVQEISTVSPVSLRGAKLCLDAAVHPARLLIWHL